MQRVAYFKIKLYLCNTELGIIITLKTDIEQVYNTA